MANHFHNHNNNPSKHLKHSFIHIKFCHLVLPFNIFLLLLFFSLWVLLCLPILPMLLLLRLLLSTRCDGLLFGTSKSMHISLIMLIRTWSFDGQTHTHTQARARALLSKIIRGGSPYFLNTLEIDFASTFTIWFIISMPHFCCCSCCRQLTKITKYAQANVDWCQWYFSLLLFQPNCKKSFQMKNIWTYA